MNTTGNKLIMDFLGWKHHSRDVYWFPNLYPSHEHYTGETTFNIDEARFHSSWDWQIPVWRKFYNTMLTEIYQNNHDRLRGQFDIWKHNFHSAVDVNSVKDGFNILILALQWYNEEQNVEVSDTTEAK